MAQKKITELDTKNSILDGDYLVLAGGNKTYKVSTKALEDKLLAKNNSFSGQNNFTNANTINDVDLNDNSNKIINSKFVNYRTDKVCKILEAAVTVNSSVFTLKAGAILSITNEYVNSRIDSIIRNINSDISYNLNWFNQNAVGFIVYLENMDGTNPSLEFINRSNIYINNMQCFQFEGNNTEISTVKMKYYTDINECLYTFNGVDYVKKRFCFLARISWDYEAQTITLLNIIKHDFYNLVSSQEMDDLMQSGITDLNFGKMFFKRMNSNFSNYFANEAHNYNSYFRGNYINLHKGSDINPRIDFFDENNNVVQRLIHWNGTNNLTYENLEKGTSNILGGFNRLHERAFRIDFGNNRIIYEWGKIVINQTTTAITLPYPLNDTNYMVFVSNQNTVNGNFGEFGVDTKSTTGFNITSNGGNINRNLGWMLFKIETIS